MHLLALLWALPRPSTRNALFSERRAIRGLLASACVWGRWAASPCLARTAGSQMESHGLPRSHGACLVVSVDSGQTPEASSVPGFTRVHCAAFPERQVWPQRGTRSLALQNRPSLQPGSWGTGPLVGTGDPLGSLPSSLYLPVPSRKMLCQFLGHPWLVWNKWKLLRV